jgi:hypothetical protein
VETGSREIESMVTLRLRSGTEFTNYRIFENEIIKKIKKNPSRERGVFLFRKEEGSPDYLTQTFRVNILS